MRLVIVVTQGGVNRPTKCLCHTQADATAAVIGAAGNRYKWFENLTRLVSRHPRTVIAHAELDAGFAFLGMNLNRTGLGSVCNGVINQDFDDMPHIGRIARAHVDVWGKRVMDLSLWVAMECCADNLVNKWSQIVGWYGFGN